MTKINIAFFVGNEVLNIFYSAIKKKKKLQSDWKIILGGRTLFEGKGVGRQK